MILIILVLLLMRIIISKNNNYCFIIIGKSSHQMVDVMRLACGCIRQATDTSRDEEVHPHRQSVACMSRDVCGDLQLDLYKFNIELNKY